MKHKQPHRELKMGTEAFALVRESASDGERITREKTKHADDVKAAEQQQMEMV